MTFARSLSATAAIAALSPLHCANPTDTAHVCLCAAFAAKIPSPAPKHGRQVDYEQPESASPGMATTRAITSFKPLLVHAVKTARYSRLHVGRPRPAVWCCSFHSKKGTSHQTRFSLYRRWRFLLRPGV